MESCSCLGIIQVVWWLPWSLLAEDMSKQLPDVVLVRCHMNQQQPKQVAWYLHPTQICQSIWWLARPAEWPSSSSSKIRKQLVWSYRLVVPTLLSWQLLMLISWWWRSSQMWTWRCKTTHSGLLVCIKSQYSIDHNLWIAAGCDKNWNGFLLALVFFCNQ